MGDRNGDNTFAAPGAELLDDVHAWLRSYVAFPSAHAATATTLWAAHTYLVSRFESTPRLVLVSPEPECGKTRTLELLELVTTGGWLMMGPSASSLFRRVDMAHADEPKPVTLLLDEADTIWRRGKGDESAEAVRQIINGGHRRRASVPRIEVVGNTYSLREFRTYAPCAVASKGDHLPETILSRAVIVQMRRRAPEERVRPFRERITRPEGEDLQMRLADWALGVWDRIGCADCAWPVMPDGVTDRQADIWEPLLAVAEVAGGEWPERARRACVAFVKGTRDDTASTGVRLLADLYRVFGGTGKHAPNADAMSTKTILAALHRMDESPWGDWYGKPLGARDLAKILKPYGIGPKPVRRGEQVARGYSRDDLWDAWRRYGGASVTAETSATPLTSEVTHVTAVTDDQHEQAEAAVIDLLGGTVLRREQE